MLIICPECGKEISDKSIQCIHCGCPLKIDNTICTINNKEYDFSSVLNRIKNKDNMGFVIREIRETCNLSLADSKKLYDIINENQTIPKYFNGETMKLIPNDNNAECPYCHSKNTQKITMTSKAVNTALFGIFGTKRTKQWHCNNCKSDF